MPDRSRSSSNRGAVGSDAVVVIAGRPVGAMLLPEHRAEDFIDHFNRTYAGLGMSVQPTAAPASPASPASPTSR